MKIPPERLTIKALLVLEETADAARKAQVVPSMGLRFALAYLYAVGRGDKALFDQFWQAATTTPGQQSEFLENTVRGQMTDAGLQAVYRSVGVQRTREMMFHRVRKRIGER